MRLALTALAPALLSPALLAVATSAPSPAPGLLPTGTYQYQTTLGSQRVGSSTIVVSRSGGNVEVAESGGLLGQGLVSRRTLTAASFSTSSYAADADGKHLVVSFSGNEATLTVSGRSVTIAAPSNAPFLLSDNMAAGFALLPATLHVTGAKELTLACVCGGFAALPVTVADETPERPAGVPAGDAVLAVRMQGVVATLWYNPATFVLDRFDLPSQQLSLVLQSYDPAIMTLTRPSVPTPLPQPTENYTSRDVSIRADDGVTLRGTLTMPAGPKAPRGALVFVHGSGCIDRDETIGPNKIFAQLANRLSNDGYAVLRYDKRSCGQSGGTFATRNRLIADARDVIAYLRVQPGIDPKRVYVLGHSEGGELAPSIAIADKRLRGIVLLAPPALPLEQVLEQQLMRNATDADRATMQRQVQAKLAAISTGEKGGPDVAWLRSSFGIDPARLIARVPCPILILQGTKDIQVLPADTPRLIDAAKAAHRNVTVVMLQDDDHLFLELPHGQALTGAEYFVPSYLDAALFDAIESWLSRNDD